MSEIIWLEIVKKSYNELCDNIYQSSLQNKADPVNIIFQHMLRLGSFLFFNKRILEF